MIKKCRSCKSNNIVEVLGLGNQYLSEFRDDDKKPAQYPLTLMLCTECTLVQLRDTTPQSELYTENYGYKSGINNTIKADLLDIVTKAVRRVNLSQGENKDVVIDIGANDGTLLSYYNKNSWYRVGIEPIKKWANECEKFADFVINDFFSLESYLDNLGDKKAKIITIISCFYDMEDPNKFVGDIANILAEDGIVIIQQNYLAGMLAQTAFDNIVHEHLEYYSLKSLENLLNRHGLEVFDVETNSINGGSFRTYIRHMGRVDRMRYQEEQLKLDNKWTYMLFALRVRNIAKQVHSFIEGEVKKGKTVYLFGASTRGNSLIQTCNLDNKLITAAVERNPEKWGKKIASLDIPIISEEQARKEKPDYLLVLPWFFKEEFLEREKEYLAQGGHFIFALPEFTVV